MSFEEAKQYVRKFQLKSNKEWRVFSKTKRPKNLPGAPEKIYKNVGWNGWADFLGNLEKISNE
jgi:hypothetical protein